MTVIRFRSNAESDLTRITALYDEVAPHARHKVLSDIYRSLDQLVNYRRSGIAAPGKGFRRIDTRQYHFKVAYASKPNVSM